MFPVIESTNARRGAATAAACVVALLAVLLPSPRAEALPASRTWGPMIDSAAGYDGQDTCSPDPKPGVVAFASMLQKAFPQTGSFGISRACDVGGTSEHKEGRAFDWAADVNVGSQRKAVEKVFDWLFAADRYGNENAMARRLGIMYIVWNRQIWGTWGGWSTYCVQKKIGCVKPGTKDVRHPHTDHVHFSFSWAGAKKQTTRWNKARSLVAAAGSPSLVPGYVLAGRNGAVAPFGVGYYGSKSEAYLPKPAVGIATTPGGWGYWLAFADGRVAAFGDAAYKGGAKKKKVARIVGIAAKPDGKGYWLVAKTGRVLAFGKAERYGGLGGGKATVAGMASTPTGEGYWLFLQEGKVMAFGDAQHFGDASDKDLGSAVVGGAAHGALGYWIVTADGRVLPFGDAPELGDLADKENLGSSVVGMTGSPTLGGYWIVTDKGRVFSRGDAAGLGGLLGRPVARQAVSGFDPASPMIDIMDIEGDE